MDNPLDLKLDHIFNKMKWYDKFNVSIYVLIFFTMILAPLFLVNVIYITRILRYRCFVPECDSTYINAEYNTRWLQNAIPFHESDPEKCIRYVPIHNGTNSSCNSQDFYTNQTIRCDRFVFESKYQTIAQDFEIFCGENNWKLTLPPAVGSIGTLISFPLLGIISDRYGRRNTIILAFELGAITGTLKAFSVSYYMFIILEFMGQCISGSSYLLIITYTCEQANIKSRAILVTLTGALYSLGEVLASVVSWYFYSWRYFTLAVFFPQFFVILFFWMSPESVRWLISRNRYTEAENHLKLNFCCRSKSYDNHDLNVFFEFKKNNNDVHQAIDTKNEVLKFFSHRLLAYQFLLCSVCTLSIFTIFYGLVYYLTTLHGNFFVNIVLISLIEIPAILISAPFLGHWKRRNVLLSLLFCSGLCWIGFIIFELMMWWSFIFIITAKLMITVSYDLMELYLHELFPTTIRGTLVSTCITIGFIGVQLAVQMPLLATYWSYFPPIIFVTLSYLCCCLISFLPETKDLQLPENIEEALKNFQKT